MPVPVATNRCGFRSPATRVKVPFGGPRWTLAPTGSVHSRGVSAPSGTRRTRNSWESAAAGSLAVE